MWWRPYTVRMVLDMTAHRADQTALIERLLAHQRRSFDEDVGGMADRLQQVSVHACVAWLGVAGTAYRSFGPAPTLGS